MTFKPFRPPSFVSRLPSAPVVQPPPPIDDIQDRAPKRRRLSEDPDDRKKSEFKRPAIKEELSSSPVPTQASLRAPLVSLKQASQPPPSTQTIGNVQDPPSSRTTYRALYRKVTTKKHKTWDGDGTVVLSGGYAELRNEKGKYLGRTKCTNIEDDMKIGGMDVEVGEIVTDEQTDLTADEDQVVEVPKIFARPMALTRPHKIPDELVPAATAGPKISAIISTTANQTKPATTAYTNPLNHARGAARTSSNGSATAPEPKHDPQAPGALVMRRPDTIPSGKRVVDVVVDPVVGKRLREHQRAGVAFMYECVMGMRCREGLGAILADEMGLGKTLQTIALLWTLLKQNPIYGEGPVVRKAIIICPVSVTKNWRKEFRKWLGNDRVGVLILDDQKKIRSFTKGPSYQVLVVGYEMFNQVHKDLQKCKEIDIIVADEGHRLKTAKNKTATAIKSLDVERRVVLTGTPLQNDYSEWYSVVDFVNPGYLGKYASFRKDFETPILRARQQGASPDDVEKGDEADRELKRQTGSFILRRSADILAQYLPPKTEYILLCRPTKFQIDVYNALLSSGTLSAALHTPELSFQMITLLKKACNSPSLLSRKDNEDADSLLSQLTATFTQTKLKTTNASGKIRVLDALLHQIKTTTDEKVVIMSNYTSTLDVLANLLTSLDHSFARLDGNTPQSKRQDMVDEFNRAPQARQFCFLMSTKAGGMGINLIGASRLVLFDLDWNPALDAQAMARTHRDGQKRPCFIYRLVAKGAIEEKILQRQVSKTDLAGAVVDDRRSVQAFSHEVLRDLFRLDTGPECGTHAALGCGCAMNGQELPSQGGSADVSDDEDEDELPPLPTRNFRPASEVRAETPRVEAPRGLMVYSHFDARAWRARQVAEEEEEEEGAVQDSVLQAVVAEEDSAVDFVFAKRGKAVAVS